MKIWKFILVALAITGLIFLSFGCTRNASATATPKPQITTVQRGNISIAVTGTGNLAYSNTEKLAFDMAGYVEEILVSEGDTVEKGQDLAKLNTSDWEDQIKALTKALTSAQRALVDKESALATAQRQVAAKQLAVNQAQINLQTAEYNLGQISKVKSAQSAVDSAEATLELAKNKRSLDESSVDLGYIRDLQAELDEARANLQMVLNRTSTNISTSVALDIAQKQLAVEQNKRSLEDAQVAVETALTAVKNAELDFKDAQQTVNDTRADLEESQSLSPIIKAPFAGFITKVNVVGGDEVFKGTVAVQIADPEKIEAKILVTENDVFSVILGSEAAVAVDALSGLSYPAKITRIAPTATVTQGVVNYSVVVELTSLQPVMPVRKSPNTASAVPGKATPANPPSGALPPSGTPQVGQPAVAAPATGIPGRTNSQNMSLKDGLSATVTIPIEQKENVLLIPSRAITRQGQTATVQVMAGTLTETRTVKTGLSDSSSIEVTEGLKEGEQVLVKAATTSTTQGGFRPGGFPPPF